MTNSGKTGWIKSNLKILANFNTAQRMMSVHPATPLCPYLGIVFPSFTQRNMALFSGILVSLISGVKRNP